MPLRLNNKTLLISCASLIIIALGVWMLPKAYLVTKRIRAESLTETAQELLKEKEISEAWKKMQAAYKLYPESPIVNEVIAEVYELVDVNRSLVFWDAALLLSEDPKYRKRLVQAAIKIKDINIINKHLPYLKEELKEDEDIALIEAQGSFIQGNLEQARSILKDIIALDTGNEKIRLFYAILALESPYLNEQQEAVSILKEKAISQDKTGLKALKILSKYPPLSMEDQQWIITTIQSHPLATKQDKLYSIALKENAYHLPRDTLINEAKVFFNDLENLDEQVIFGKWLNSNQYYEQTLDLISETDAIKRQDLFLIWVDAMAVRKEWAYLRNIFENKQTPLEEYLNLIFQSRIYKELELDQRASISWGKMLLLVSEDTDKLWFALDYAMKTRERSNIRKTFKALVKNHTSMLRAYKNWVYWERVQGNSDKMMQLLKSMYQLYPNDTSILNDLIYGELLKGKNIERNLIRSQLLVDQNPSFLSHRIVLSLALLRNNKPEDALNNLTGLDIEWIQTNDSYRAVLTACFLANRLNTQAETILETVNKDALLPEELRLTTKD